MIQLIGLMMGRSARREERRESARSRDLSETDAHLPGGPAHDISLSGCAARCRAAAGPRAEQPRSRGADGLDAALVAGG